MKLCRLNKSINSIFINYFKIIASFIWARGLQIMMLAMCINSYFLESISNATDFSRLGVDLYNPTETPQTNYEVIDGVKYRKFKNEFGSLYVPLKLGLTEKEMEQSFCSDRIEKRGKHSVSIIKADKKLINEVKFYVELIQKTIKEKCRGSSSATSDHHQEEQISLSPELELGFSKEIKNKSVKKIKIFNKNLGTNLNFGLDF